MKGQVIGIENPILVADILLLTLTRNGMSERLYFDIVIEAIYRITKIDLKNARILISFVLIEMTLPVLETSNNSLINFPLSILEYIVHLLFVYFCHKIFLADKDIQLSFSEVKWTVFAHFALYYIMIVILLAGAYMAISYLLQEFIVQPYGIHGAVYTSLVFLCMIFPSIFIARLAIMLPVIVKESNYRANIIWRQTNKYFMPFMYVIFVVAAVYAALSLLLGNYLFEYMFATLINNFLVLFVVSMLCVLYKRIEVQVTEKGM